MVAFTEASHQERSNILELNLVSKKVTVEKDGETKTYTNFFLETVDGQYVAIKPAFKQDYKVLVVLASATKNI